MTSSGDSNGVPTNSVHTGGQSVPPGLAGASEKESGAHSSAFTSDKQPADDTALCTSHENCQAVEATSRATKKLFVPKKDVPVTEHEKFRATEGLPDGWLKVVRVAPLSKILVVTYYGPERKPISSVPFCAILC